MAFILTSAVLTTTVGYSSHVYFLVYGAIRNLKITPELEVEVLDNSGALMNTTVTIENPSECPLELVYIYESLSLEGESITSETLGTKGTPIPIHPMSTVTVSIEATVPSYKVEFVKTHLDERWIVRLRVYLAGPVVEGFNWADSWLITNVSKS